MSILSTGPIENNPVSGIRPSTQVTVKIDNKSSVNSSTVTIQGFALDGSRTLYVLELFSVAPNQVVTKTYFANINALEFVFITGGDAEADTDISVWGKNAAGQLVTAHRLVSSELLGEGDGAFIWGEETIIWADSGAPGPGDGTPSDPFNSLQAAIDAATNNPLATTFGMRARLIILIAANSVFNEDIVIPPARHVQLLGLGPWVLGNADLANFGSSIPRNITIQTSNAEENIYQSQGPEFIARPVTVIGTFDNGTSVSAHTNYTNGAIISGDISFQNLDPIDPFTTIEFQLLNARVVGSIIPDPVDPHQGTINTYIFNSRINNLTKPGLRIQRMVDTRVDGTINVAVYSNVTNTWFRGDVTITTTLVEVPPIGIFSSQFDTITWTGPLILDTASNFYFVNSVSTLVGTKTVLFSLA